ncbi:choice-of-anchor tandem repeat GloVer-containing protein [Flavicella sp.]|uniref:choice-of-anchor tandem repeat GloVer-containing protein n=1 Tax=Flavicella sp. TaxID=2957742 RepID=UPI00260CC1AA|nr:choice-of-anchor tandem repeat GloVer-containing protein [Flavicella sp.]MDG1804395.1 T9SS type A sorting domain-containing protein [Flavicella sp.]
MKKTTLIIISCLVTLSVFSQIISVPLSNGGTNNSGTILQVDANNSNYQAASMSGLIGTGETGVDSNSQLLTAYSGVHHESTNNSLYIVAKDGFRNITQTEGTGIIFRYDLTNQTTHLIRDFDLTNAESGRYPFGKLHKIGSLLYGVALSGGAYGFGTIFSIDPVTDTYSVLHSFNGTTDGGNPSCNLYADGSILYGGGGRGNGEDGEVYFSYNTSTSTYTTLFVSNLTANNNIRGLMKYNSSLFISKGDAIVELNLNSPGDGVSNYYLGSGSPQTGRQSWEPAFITGQSSWFTTFSEGGINNNKGSIAKYNFGNQSMSNVHNFQGSALGEQPSSALINGLNGDAYGIAYTGTNNDYLLYKYSSIGFYSVIHVFDDENEGLKVQASPVLVGAKIYGIAEIGGSNRGGTIWVYDIASGTTTVEAQLGYIDGKSPQSGLVLNPNTQNLDFMSYTGGQQFGTINSLNTANNTISNNVSLDDQTSIERTFHKPIYYNNKTYILVELTQGAISNNNSIYALSELNVATGKLTGSLIPIAPVSDLNDIGNTVVFSNIIQDNNMLYGSSRQHLWSIDLSTDTYTTLHTFNTSAEGNDPTAIIIDNSVVYGLNKAGGSNGTGTTFSFDLNSSTFTTLENTASSEVFSGIQKDGDFLYAIHNDGSSNYAVSKMDISAGTPTFTNQASIDNNSVGSTPGPNLSIYNQIVYGVLNDGGANNLGGLFKYDTNSDTVSSLLPFDNTTGHYSYNSELLVTSGSLGFDKVDPATKLAVYPNPSEGVFNITLDDIDQIEVYDVNGRFLFENKNSNSVDLSSHSSGQYVLRISTNNKVYNIQIIKE